jgi:hypothetical protein
MEVDDIISSRGVITAREALESRVDRPAINSVVAFMMSR